MKLNLIIGLILLYILCIGISAYVATRTAYDSTWQILTTDKFKAVNDRLETIEDKLGI